MPSSGNSREKILLIRNDRIGDLVLTIPAITVLRRAFPEAVIDLLCSSYARPVVEGNPDLDSILTDCGAHDSSDLKKLIRKIIQRQYTTAVVMVHSYKNLRLVRQAKIPLRIGPLVRWYAPFFLNRPLRQHRSRAEKNEAAYNLELLAPLGIEKENLPPPRVSPSPEAVEKCEELLASIFNKDVKLPLAIIHPGMGGSALNWPVECWQELARKLETSGKYKILVTGNDSEAELAQKVVSAADSPNLVRALSGLSLEDFIALLSLARAVAAPSTGPLHLASALGVPVVAGIYSPLRVHHPKRWGALGEGKVMTFLPDVSCHGSLDCLGDRCEFFPCMNTIGPEEVSRFLIEHSPG